MSNASLKEQLEAVATQLTGNAPQPSPKPDSRPPMNPKPRPAEALKKPKPRWLDYVQYGVELLKVYFPHSFRSMRDVKPLKLGIKQDLVKQLSTMETIVTEDKACMAKSLTYYVNTLAYHKSVVEGAERIDLAGQPVGKVTPEEARYSMEKSLEKQQAKQAMKQNPAK